VTSVDPPGESASKNEWRVWARATRSGLDFATLTEATVEGLLGWPPLAAARNILIFLPLADEIQLNPLLDAGFEGTFHATRTPDRGGRLTINELNGPLEVHRLGFLQPHTSARELDPADLDMALVPGLAFDLFGTRLGRGAGYYDALLAGTPAKTSIVGVTPATLVVDTIPRESHDVTMAWLATEEGLIETAG